MKIGPFLPYNKNLLPLARENRKNPTLAEQRMWKNVLRQRKLTAYKFLRQKPIDGYIVDFYCAELGLVIEIDGEIHAEQAEYDQERTKILNAYGLTVLRYNNEAVLNNTFQVAQQISEKVAHFQASLTSKE